MSSPSYEAWSDDVELPSLVPIYPLTSGISQKQIAKDMRSAFLLVSTDKENVDPLPEEIRLKNKLCTRSYAQKNIHSPDNFAALAAAKKRLIFDEFFTFALGISAMGNLPSSNKTVRKELKNGILYIVSDSKTYTIL